MLLDTECPHCREDLRIDSGYLGIKRTCPECGEKFLFEQDGADTSDFGGPVRIGCPVCLRIAAIPKAYDFEDYVACGVCSARRATRNMFGKGRLSALCYIVGTGVGVEAHLR